jgi:hypothetical protein
MCYCYYCWYSNWSNILSNINQSVASVTVSDGGTGYKGTVTATFSAGNAVAGSVTVASSSITGATITTVGSGYSTAPTITVAAPPSGTTATINSEQFLLLV